MARVWIHCTCMHTCKDIRRRLRYWVLAAHQNLQSQDTRIYREPRFFLCGSNYLSLHFAPVKWKSRLTTHTCVMGLHGGILTKNLENFVARAAGISFTCTMDGGAPKTSVRDPVSLAQYRRSISTLRSDFEIEVGNARTQNLLCGGARGRWFFLTWKFRLAWVEWGTLNPRGRKHFLGVGELLTQELPGKHPQNRSCLLPNYCLIGRTFLWRTQMISSNIWGNSFDFLAFGSTGRYYFVIRVAFLPSSFPRSYLCRSPENTCTCKLSASQNWGHWAPVLHVFWFRRLMEFWKYKKR